jgi:hypothetical protein
VRAIELVEGKGTDVVVIKANGIVIATHSQQIDASWQQQ